MRISDWSSDVCSSDLPPVDECADLPGTQTDPADCPPPVDECSEMPGLQTDPPECDTIVAGVVITPTPTPVAAPPVVAGTQVSSPPLPVTGTAPRRMPAAAILLILRGAALALSALRAGAILTRCYGR